MSVFMSGLRPASPVVFGYVPVGFAFGILAVQAGFSPITAGLMSLLVYAGAAQLIAVNMLLGGAGVASVIAMTFLINLRHLLMAVSLTPYISHWSKAALAWFGFEMTDETYALNLHHFLQGNTDQTVSAGVNFFSHAGWVAGSVLGACFGDVLGDTTRYGIDFALPAMFIALVIPHLRISGKAVAVASGAAASVILLLLGAKQVGVLLAALAGATVACFVAGPVRPSGKGRGGKEQETTHG